MKVFIYFWASCVNILECVYVSFFTCFCIRFFFYFLLEKSCLTLFFSFLNLKLVQIIFSWILKQYRIKYVYYTVVRSSSNEITATLVY